MPVRISLYFKILKHGVGGGEKPENRITIISIISVFTTPNKYFVVFIYMYIEIHKMTSGYTSSLLPSGNHHYKFGKYPFAIKIPFKNNF